MWVYIWLGVLALSLIIEFVTMELVSVWVSLGSLVAMILALCGVQIEIQIAVFVVVSVACILGLRRVTLRLLNKSKGKTNLDAVVGTQQKLIKSISKDENGLIKYNGIEWTAKSQNNEDIQIGEYVEVLEVEGNKFIVKKIAENNKILKNEEIEETSKEDEAEVSSTKNPPKKEVKTKRNSIKKENR